MKSIYICEMCGTSVEINLDQPQSVHRSGKRDQFGVRTLDRIEVLEDGVVIHTCARPPAAEAPEESG